MIATTIRTAFLSLVLAGSVSDGGTRPTEDGGMRLGDDPAAINFTEPSILLTPSGAAEPGKEWLVRPIKVPAVNDAKPFFCFGRTNDRQVSCFYFAGRVAVVLEVTLDGETV